MKEQFAPRKPGRPTLSDIARALDVSEATVSRALRGSPEISEQTRAAIRRVARDLGYVPNAAARNLARQTSRTLGLLVPDVTDPVHALVVAGFGRAADSRGYTVIVMDGSRDEARRTRSLRTLIEHQAEGIVFCSTPLSMRETIEEVRPAHAVFILHEGADAVLASETPLGRVRADDELGIRLMVEHLLGLGKRRLSYVNGPDIASNRLRRNAILRSLEALGIEPRIREYSTGEEQTDFESVARLVARERPDALLCYDDKMALHMLDALRRADVSVPDDLAVTGFDGIPFAAISNPRLTTVIQPADLLGETAAGALFDAIENGTPPPDVTFPVTLAIRGSSRRRVAETEGAVAGEPS
ncbi:LacI family DNA-binding transcriptional regulator [Mesorhizobium sp. LHD-90]|uniref:LacI family DNA-binding transcriptional regulator n=1 Tax=Mesorhizobium sp. LHD-90 TaxID=3071414 RepID=UPI0027DEE6F6|nr:LacI family DNA-binding transcriptional regulator [Mesorhizobium sp. LHD-90]MDQ6433825.1 LacI family DNA-binding transcriptional regulator [Mesorhizobium sp. LHD-90]